jgi:ABC-2 type transport system permease protein
MFRAIWIKTLRDYRWPTLAWGLGLGFMIMLTLVTYSTQITAGAAQEEAAKLALQFNFFGEPIATNTATGYTTWKVLDLSVPAMLCIWTVLAGARMLRGEEDKGSMDVLLSTPQSRTSVILQKLLAFGIALAIVGILMALLAVLGEVSGGVVVDWWGAIVMGLNASLLAAMFGVLALFISQFTQSQGAAAGAAGALMVLSFLLDSIGRSIVNPVTSFLQHLSPFYYYNWNKPLIAQSEFAGNVWGYVILIALVVVLAGASVYLFTRREIGGVAWSSRAKETEAQAEPLADRNAQALAKARRSVFGRSVGLQAIRAQAGTVLWWLVGVAIFTILMTSAVPALSGPIKDLLKDVSTSVVVQIYSGLGIGTDAGILSTLIFQFVPVITILFIMTVALSWPSDLDSGRMELVLGTPEPRSRIVLERLGAVLVAAIAMPVLVWLSVWVGAQFAAISIDVGKLTAASLGILPMELIVIGLVYALSERLRLGVILSVVSAFIVVSYVIDLLGAALNLPEWVKSLSIFHVYGTPFLSGWQAGPFFGMIAVALALLVLGFAQFSRVDVERGA